MYVDKCTEHHINHGKYMILLTSHCPYFNDNGNCIFAEQTTKMNFFCTLAGSILHTFAWNVNICHAQAC